MPLDASRITVYTSYQPSATTFTLLEDAAVFISEDAGQLLDGPGVIDRGEVIHMFDRWSGLFANGDPEVFNDLGEALVCLVRTTPVK